MQTLQSAFLAIVVLAGGWWALEQTDQTGLDPDAEEFFVEDPAVPLVSGMNSEQWFSGFPKPSLQPPTPTTSSKDTSEPFGDFPSLNELAPEQPLTIKTLEPLSPQPATQESARDPGRTPASSPLGTETLAPVTKSLPQPAEPIAIQQTVPASVADQPPTSVNKAGTTANLASMTSSNGNSPNQQSSAVLATSSSQNAPNATKSPGLENSITRWSELTPSGQPIGWSLQNKPINGYRMGEGVQRVLIIAGLAGTDRVTPRWLEEMLSELQKSRPAWLSQLTLVAVPRANPDGLNLGQLGNARQVELSQNFPTASFHYGLATNGSGPASEPEVRALMRLMGEFSPERMIVLSNSNTLTEVRYGPLAAASVSRWSEQFGIRTEPLFVAGREQACVEYAEKVLGVPSFELCLNPATDSQQGLSTNQNLWQALLTAEQTPFTSLARPQTSTPVRVEKKSPVAPTGPSSTGYEELSPPP